MIAPILIVSVLQEWKRLVPKHLGLPPAGPSFYARVFHPAFNLDADDAASTVDCFETHTRAVGKGVQGLRNIFGQVRQARIGEPPLISYDSSLTISQEMSKAERLLSYSLLSLITGKALASAPMTGLSEDDTLSNPKGKGIVSSDGAWCWREGCAGASLMLSIRLAGC
jgi:sorting nexin-9/18/33